MNSAFVSSIPLSIYTEAHVTNKVGIRGNEDKIRVRRNTRCMLRMTASSPSTSEQLVLSTERASKLPWTKTIAEEDFPLLFMPFLTHQMSKMNELDGLEDLQFAKELSHQTSTKRAARIESWQWKTNRFRKIRATYIDAGVNAQVFNSVWYPDSKFEHPLLGIDFLSFGKKKVLCVMDFQPLTQDTEYLERYCVPMQKVKEQYDGISGTMSKRFYDEVQFFSKQLVFAKFDTQEPIQSQLFPAFQDYLEKYIEMIQNATPNDSEESMDRVNQLQKEYDEYSAERDPAVGLFSTYWGKEWAERFTHEFLFSDSTPPQKE